MSHTADDIAEKVLNALAEHGYDARVFLSGEDAPEGAPFVLIRPEEGQVWCLRIEGPMNPSTPEGIAEAAVALGFATADPA
ncbi:hypothetical protein [Streptomyces tsukubensis]|uniref:hypothetical protein n=1 Tax=Streptomyces tsukubensis TaxID=83656 RepID=UPI00344F3609